MVKKLVCLAVWLTAVFQPVTACKGAIPSSESLPTQDKRMNKTQEMLDAVTAGHTERVRALLESDASLSQAKDRQGTSVILLAIFGGKQTIAELIASRRGDLNIFEAAALGSLERASRLVAEDSNLASAYGADGFTALHYAAHLGHLEIAKLLIAKGADVKAVSRNGLAVMPLQSAVAGRQVPIIRLLLENDAPVNANTKLHDELR